MFKILPLLQIAAASALAALPQQNLEVFPLPAPPFEAAPGALVIKNDQLYSVGSSQNRTELWTAPAGNMQQWQPMDIAIPQDAAIAGYDQGLAVIGGREDMGLSGKAFLVDLIKTQPIIRKLPDLPKPVAGASAAVVGETLYVFGGLTSLHPEEFSKDLWIIDLPNPTAWRSGSSFPGDERAFSASTEQYGMLCLFGGRGEKGLLSETWVFRPVPLEGTKTSGWKRLSDVPSGSVAATAVPVGQAQVMVLSDAPAEGENAAPLLFHTLTGAWCAFDTAPGLAAPQAGRAGNKIFVMGRSSSGQPVAAELRIPRNVRNLVWIDYLVIGVYFVALSGIGFYFSRKQDTSVEFSLGNRKVKWWAAGISMFATGASAISFMAIPALAFATNLVWLFPLAAMIPAYFLTAHFIYPLLRRMEITSTYEYLERRFNRALRVIASLQAIVFQTLAKAGVVLLLPSLAISSVTGMSVYTSVLIMGIVTTIYTAIGGFDAVIWTEVLQATLMLLAPIAIMWVCVTNLPGGMGEFVSTSASSGKFDFALLTWDVTVPAVWVLLVMAFLNNTVVPAGDQPIVQRVFSAPLPEVRKVNLTFTVCGILIGAMTNIMGLTIFAYFRARPEMLDPMSQNDQIVPLFVAQAMPVGFAGLVIAAIFAAAMSTVASIMNSVATIFTEDFYMKFKPAATDRQRLFTLKTASYIIGMIGTAMALLLAAQDLKSMMVVWTQFTALLGGGIVGVYSLGMFSKRANGFGAICGAIGSIAITGAVKLYTTLHWGTYVPIAIFSCIIIGYICSLMRPAKANLHGLTVYTPANIERPI